MSEKARRASERVKAIVYAAQSEGRELTTAERTEAKNLLDGAFADIAAVRRRDRLDGPSYLHGAGNNTGGGLGDQFVRSAGWKRISDPNGRGQQWSSGPVELSWRGKGGTLLEGSTGSGFTPTPEVVPGIVTKLFERPTIANLFSQGQVSTSSLRFAVEGTAVPGATAVSEGGVKPESDLSLGVVDEQVRKIATVISVSDELLEDGADVQAYLNDRLATFVSIQEDYQLLHGNGTAPNLSGVFDRAGLRTYPRGTVDANHVAVFKAANGLRGSAFVEPTALIVNPANYQTSRLAADSTGQLLGGGPWQGQYGTGSQVGSSYPTFQDRMWGIPTIVTSQIGAGTALLGDFRNSARLYRRGGLTVEASNSHASFFQENMVMIRAELRAALAMYREDAFVQITGLT
jgi:HK97 family phage major capsid protein